ncbi:MAG TPA: hypothetical protein VHC44_08760 [Verrucomicrobiae bacterium]|nr:hypothetical protein [Verrucomicrobiae bacterium]
MSFSLSARKLVVCLYSLVAIPVVVFSQNSFAPNGGEYSPTGKLPGDQVHPAVSLTTNGGYVVWEDYWIDGKGLGIGAMHLNNDLTGSGVPFRVDSLNAGDQESAHVSTLNGGGAVFAWQSGLQGRQHIFARFLSSSNSWTTGDVMVNSATNKFQNSPVVATLLNGNVAVAYVSVNQAGAGSMADVYLQMFSPSGIKLGGEILVNQFTAKNQRTPAIAALTDGKFAIAWVSEQERWTDASNGVPSVDIYARIFDSTGNPVGSELLINSASTVCAAPDLAAAPDGGFMATWMARDLAVKNNGWDISARRFSSAWVGGNETRVNTQLYGDQYAPRLRRAGSTYLDVWTSTGQDGSREGVFASYLNDDGSTSGSEFQVNSTTLGSQMHQALGTDGAGRLLAVWTSFDADATGYNLYGQIYLNPSLAVVGTNNIAFNTDPNANPNSVSNAPAGGGDGGGGQVGLPPVDPGQTSGGGTPSTFAEVKGTYNGLVYDPNNVTAANSGYVTITTTVNKKSGQGSFSAKLQMGGKKYSFSGPFDASGAYTGNVGGLTVSLQIDLYGGDRITGQISNGSWTVSLLANREVFSKTHLASLAGTYTMVIQPTDGSMGNSVGSVTVSTTGAVKWAFTLADGAKIGGSTTLSKDGAWPLYSQPYKNGGVTVGWMQFGAKSSDGFDGPCVWTKPSGSGVYPQGLTKGVTVSGSYFKTPSAFGSSQLILSGGGLAEPIVNTVTWQANNKVVAGSGVKLSVNASSGLFQGTVAVAPGKGGTVSFQGVLFEKNNIGLGFFLGSGQSGTVSFAPNN